MEPAFLPQHIFENILQFFNDRELRNLMCTSKTWYKSITTSSVLMKNSTLAIRNDWMNDEGDMETIIECSYKRNFQKLLISDGSELYKEIFEVLLSPQCYFKSIEINDMKFDSYEKFEELVKTFASSVQTLRLDRISVQDEKMSATKQLCFSVKNLKELKVSHCDSQILTAMLRSASKLTSLEIGFGMSKLNVAETLNKCANLKTLKMNGECMNVCFSNANTNCDNFQLEELTISYIEKAIPHEVIENFLKFLNAQNNLKDIDLGGWFGIYVLESIFKMCKLKKLTLFNIPHYEMLHKLTSNKSIKILDVRTLDTGDNIENIESLLLAAPELKNLKMRQINENIAKFIAENLKKLSTITLVHPCDIEKFNELLPHIKLN